nr:type I restriction endonuclease [Rhizobium leguminosarum]
MTAGSIKHQIEFTIRLGHATITVKGRESWIKRGRADILLVLNDKPLAIMELKRSNISLTHEDGKQGLSYARLLPVMAPFVVVTNGNQTRIIETFSGQPLRAESPDAESFEALLDSAGKVAAGDRDDAISTLMGTDPQIWTSAVAAASSMAVEELTDTADGPRRPFGPLKIQRSATRQLAEALRDSRLVLVSGPPLVGKTNVLEQLIRFMDLGVAGGLLLECGASEIFRKIADLLSDALDWPLDPEAARNWVRQISRAGGPALVLAIDRLDPEDRDDVRMIEDLMSSRFGNGLRIAAGLDEDATRRAMTSSDGRRESVIGRHAAIVEVDDLTDAEYVAAQNALAELNMAIMDGGGHSPDLRRPWLLQAMATRVATLESKLSTSDIDWLIRNGYLTPSITDENTPVLNVTLPELLASELARHLATELATRVEGDPVDAAEWLAGAASNFLFGDIIAAQAFLDLSAGNRTAPLALFEALANMRPFREPTHAGQHLSTWVNGVGSVDLRPQEDGSTIVTINGEDHVVDTEGDPGEVKHLRMANPVATGITPLRHRYQEQPTSARS